MNEFLSKCFKGIGMVVVVVAFFCLCYFQDSSVHQWVNFHFPQVKLYADKFASQSNPDDVTPQSSTDTKEPFVKSAPTAAASKEVMGTSVPSSTPVATIVVERTAPAQTVDLAQLSQAHAEWPKTVVLKKMVEFAAVLDGKVIGHVDVQVGTRVQLVIVTPGNIGVQYQGGGATLNAGDTDLIDQIISKRNVISGNPLMVSAVTTLNNPQLVNQSPLPSGQTENTLPPEMLAAVLTITGPEGAGTGFLCMYQGKTYIATNQHVLGVGAPMVIRTNKGVSLSAGGILAATDADIALIECATFPSDITPLTIATLPDSTINSNDSVIIPGNSKGDGVITKTPGKLLAIGPQRIEVDNPVYQGNSGSPIVHMGSHKIIGVLTEATLITLNQFDKASFRSKNSSIKSEIRYFGHRIDSVQKWEPLDFQEFQETEKSVTQSMKELNWIFSYFNGSSNSFKEFRDLHVSWTTAYTIYADKNHSLEDKKEAYETFLRDIDSYARRAAFRLTSHKVYFSQLNDVQNISRMTDVITGGLDIAKRDNELLATLLQRGN